MSKAYFAPDRVRAQIILPTFNASRWFKLALDSVAEQDGIEVLVIDDGSDAREREVVAAHCRGRKGVRFLGQPHRGLVGTLNYGLSLATAPYIARMDADDISLPGRFQKQCEFLDQQADTVVVGTQIHYIDENGTRKSGNKAYPTGHRALVSELLLGRCLIQHPSVLMRRTALERVGGYDPKMEFAEDYDLWLRLSQIGELRNLDDVLLLYRRHSSQVSTPDNVKQKVARDKALLRARLSSPGQSRSERQWQFETIEKYLDKIYATEQRARDQMSLSWRDIRVIGAAFSQDLYGEATGFKKRIIKTIRKHALLGRPLTTTLACWYLKAMLLVRSANRISKATLAVRD